MPSLRSVYSPGQGLVFTGYLLFFLLLFLQFPLSGSLPGNTDTWFNLANFNDIANRFSGLFTGAETGHSYFPDAQLYFFGEPSFGNAVLFLPFRLAGIPDLWAYYFFISSLLSLNAFGCFLIAKEWFGTASLAWFSGLIFAANNFAFGNLDQAHALAWPFALFSIYFFLRFLKEGHIRSMLWCGFFGGMEIWFSGYIYVFQSVVLGIIGLFYIKKIFREGLWKALLPGLVLFVLPILPFVNMYLINPDILSAFNPAIEANGAEIASLDLVDFTRSLKHNLIYPMRTDFSYPLLYGIRAANLGILIYLLAIWGFLKAGKEKWMLLAIFIAGLILAFGPAVHAFGMRIPMPMGWINEWTGLGNFLRTPSRAFTICVLVLALFAGKGVYFAARRFRHALPAALILLLLFFAENIPVPFEKYPSSRYLDPPKEYLEWLAEKPVPGVLLNLPSSLFYLNDPGGEIDEYSREHIYAYWQTRHRHHVVNGSSGFFPESRVRNNLLIREVETPGNLEALIRENDLDWICWHKELKLKGETDAQLQWLRGSDRVELVKESDRVVIFHVLPDMDLEPDSKK